MDGSCGNPCHLASKAIIHVSSLTLQGCGLQSSGWTLPCQSVSVAGASESSAQLMLQLPAANLPCLPGAFPEGGTGPRAKDSLWGRAVVCTEGLCADIASLGEISWPTAPGECSSSEHRCQQAKSCRMHRGTLVRGNCAYCGVAAQLHVICVSVLVSVTVIRGV